MEIRACGRQGLPRKAGPFRRFPGCLCLGRHPCSWSKPVEEVDGKAQVSDGDTKGFERDVPAKQAQQCNEERARLSNGGQRDKRPRNRGRQRQSGVSCTEEHDEVRQHPAIEIGPDRWKRCHGAQRRWEHEHECNGGVVDDTNPENRTHGVRAGPSGKTVGDAMYASSPNPVRSALVSTPGPPRAAGEDTAKPHMDAGQGRDQWVAPDAAASLPQQKSRQSQGSTGIVLLLIQ